MFVGHAKDHAGDTCSMWSKNTGEARATRDVIWLRSMCFPTPPTHPEVSLSPLVDGMELSSEKAGEGDDPKDGFKDEANGGDNSLLDGDSKCSDNDNGNDHFPGSQVLDVETPSDDKDSEESAADEDDDIDDNRQDRFAPTKLGRQSEPPSNFADEFNQLGSNKRDKEMGNVAADVRAKKHVPELTQAEVSCCKKMQESANSAVNR